MKNLNHDFEFAYFNLLREDFILALFLSEINKCLLTPRLGHMW